MKREIPMVVIRRLPKYLRLLSELMNKDIVRISSKELSDILGKSASQVRHDFNYFGEFGQHGYGYNVKDTYNNIKNILGLVKDYSCILIGAGNLGHAILNYSEFSNLGFKIKAIFDANPKIIDGILNEITVKNFLHLEQYLKEFVVDIAIICVPKSQANNIYNVLIDSKVKSIWNFSPLDLSSTEHTFVENVHLSDSLLTLSYFIKNLPN